MGWFKSWLASWPYTAFGGVAIAGVILWVATGRHAIAVITAAILVALAVINRQPSGSRELERFIMNLRESQKAGPPA